MDDNRPHPLTITLRQMVEADLPVLFMHQQDPEAARLAAFPMRDRDEFSRHWTTVLNDSSAITSTILVDGANAGYVTSWVDQKTRKVGYCLDRAFWGKGVATLALQQFIGRVRLRPLIALVAKHNLPSIRVLEKCGFVRIGVASAEEAHSAEGVVEELVFELN